MFGKLIPQKKRSNLGVRSEDYPIARFRQEFDQLWDRFWHDWHGGALGPADESQWLGSRLDWDENEKEYVLQAQLPGFEPEELDVKISGNLLTLRAEHREEGKEENGGYQRFGSFYESFTLPQGVDADRIDASYHSGILELHLPKSEETETQRIEVKQA